jgi:hypothetical protein
VDRPADVEFHVGGGEFFDDVAGVGQRSGQAVKLGDCQGLTGMLAACGSFWRPG